MGNSNKIGKMEKPWTGNKIVLKPVQQGDGKNVIPLNRIDDLLVFDVYEGYRKLGRYKIGDILLKFK